MFVVLHNLHIIAREETTLALSIDTHPPVFVHHFNVGHKLALTQLNFIVFGLFIVKLDLGAQSALGLLWCSGFGRSTAKVVRIFLKIPFVWNSLLKTLNGKSWGRRVLLLVGVGNTLTHWHSNSDGGALAYWWGGRSWGARLLRRRGENLLSVMLGLRLGSRG
jgi:hypothetical protein